MRFYLDENLPASIAEIARGLGLDVVSLHEVGRDELTDEEQLRLAALDGRCVVTKDRDDFIRLTVEFFSGQRPHAGVLIVSRSMSSANPAGIAHALATYAHDHEDETSNYLLDFLS